LSGVLEHSFLPVIVGARVGDAMGAPTEGMSFEEIERRLGWVSTFTGDGTDDSLMATLLAEALVASGGHAGPDEWGTHIVANRDRILEKRDSFFVSVLHATEKLAYGFVPRRVAAGNMPSSSSAMCIWPVGLIHVGNPRTAASHAYGLAALIHAGEADFCQDAAAAVAAAIATALRPGSGISDATEAALAVIHPVSGAAMRTLIADSVTAADESPDYKEFRKRYREEFARPIQCDARETVPAAFALAALAGGDLALGVEYAANFGRDSDTVATITGALCGALTAPDDIPARWQADLGSPALDAAQSLARELARVARARAQEWINLARDVPGLLETEST
jgi:ADP-ribosylglycohydrolase